MKTTLPIAALLCACSLNGFAADDTPPAPPAKPAVPAPAAPTLKMGDPAPEFKVTQWYKGEPVTLEQDKNYIIECWATWCGPCIAAFPHLSELAKANEGKVTVIGVNVWERKKPEEVKAFVEKQGDKMSYLVAADGEQVIAKDWLKAAGRNGIPCAFVVSKGRIAWIGHPAALKQDLLTSIVDGKVSIDDLVKAKEKEEAPAKFFAQHVGPLVAKKDIDGALAKLEEMKKQFPDQQKTIDRHIETLKARQKKSAE